MQLLVVPSLQRTLSSLSLSAVNVHFRANLHRIFSLVQVLVSKYINDFVVPASQHRVERVYCP
jgi:hypothetical protein